MKTCILHIGTEKTGTTALQAWLYENRDELSGHGVYLSTKLDAPNNRIFPAYFSRQLDEWAQVNGVRSMEEKNAFFQDFETDLRKEFSAALEGHDYIVISSEHLHSRITTPGEVERIKAFLDTIFDRTTIVCYFRNQASMALSLFSTSLKFGHTTGLADFMELAQPDNYYYNFEEIANTWSGVFGRNNCAFRIFDTQTLLGSDIRKDFLYVAFPEYDLSAFSFPTSETNESLSRAAALMFRAVNLAFPSLPDKQTSARKITRTANKSLKRVISAVFLKLGGKIVYSGMTEVNARFGESNSRFFAQYFDGMRYF